MKKMYFMLCLAVLMVSTQMKGFGQILAWDFYANNSSTAATYPSTYNDSNVDASELTRGAGAPSGGGYSYGFGAGFSTAATDLTSAKENNAYLEFKVVAKEGYLLSLSDIDVKLRRQANSAHTYRWTYRKTGQTEYSVLGAMESTIVLDPDNDQGITQPTLDLTAYPDLQNIAAGDTITFRLYAWGATSSTSNYTTAIGKSASSQGAISLMLRGVTTTSPVTLSSHPQIAAWEFSALPNVTNGSVNATSSDPNLNTIPVLSRGSGLTAGSYARAYTSTLDEVTDAETAGKYYQIELNTKEGYYTTLSTLLFRYRSLGTGPKSYQWKYSLDEGTPVNIGSVGTFPSINSDGWDILLDLSDIAGLRNITPETNVKLMLYMWGNTAANAVNGFGRFAHATTAFNSIYIRGAVTDQPLPVKLTSFTAQKTANGVKLNWQTASEDNNSHFEIYKSATGKPDIFVGSINGAGNSSQVNNYSLTDYEPFMGTNYYQLRQVNNNGSYTESAVISINTGLEESAIKVYASSGSEIKVWAVQSEAGKGTLQITDISGRNIYKQTINLQVGENLLSIPFNSSAGVYVVSLTSDRGEHLNAKFIR